MLIFETRFLETMQVSFVKRSLKLKNKKANQGLSTKPQYACSSVSKICRAIYLQLFVNDDLMKRLCGD